MIYGAILAGGIGKIHFQLFSTGHNDSSELLTFVLR